jgi:TolB-like protein
MSKIYLAVMGKNKTLPSIILIAVLLTSLTFLTGCLSMKAFWNVDADLIDYSYKIADKLIERAMPPIGPDQTILIASLVDINNLEVSSGFGRTISEQIASRLTQNLYKVIQVKLRKTLYMKKSEGELMLSREVYAISAEHNAQYAVVGTYSVANYIAYVHSSIVRLSDNRIISAYDCEVPLGKNNRKLLSN